MKISREEVNKSLSRLNFNPSELRDQIRHKAPKDVPQPDQLMEKRLLALAADAKSPEEALCHYERIIKGNELMNVNYLERGNLAAKPVGRVYVRDSQGNPIGFGTGFLIAPGVLLTNHHVLEDASVAAASSVEFDFELDVNGKDKPTHRFALQPDRLFLTSNELDYTCVATDLKSEDSDQPISDYGFLKLIAEPGEILAAEYVSIIQYPDGERKQVAIRENKVLRVADDVLWYATDTLQGSSGSPVFNNSWQVVGLHHLGVPRTDDHGNWLTRDGLIWDESMDEDRVDWIANDGIRISRIIADLKAKMANNPLLTAVLEESHQPLPAQAQSEQALFDTEEDAGLAQSAPVPHNGGSDPESLANPFQAIVSIPLRISVALAENQVALGRAMIKQFVPEGEAVSEEQPVPEELEEQPLPEEPFGSEGAINSDSVLSVANGAAKAAEAVHTATAVYGHFSGTPKTEWLVSPTGPDREMRLLEEFWYEDPEGKRWMAPAGSVVDGASIPRVLWSSVGSPYTDDYRCASVVHDIACRDSLVSRKEADKMFYFACIAGGCSAAQARILYSGVRIGAFYSSLSRGVAHRAPGLEHLAVRAGAIAAQEGEILSKFQEVISLIDCQHHEISFEELEQIVDSACYSGGL